MKNFKQFMLELKEFIKKDGARRRVAGGDGRKSKKSKEEKCADLEDEDEEELSSSCQVFR